MAHFRSFIWRTVCIFALLGSAASSIADVTFTNSPSAVSNAYNGTITLRITGLTNGETVVVQKFLDVNTNGVIGPGDLLVQQFQLTDGQASVFGGVTNFNVPGDGDSTAGQITTTLNFQNGDFAQNFVGQYLYKLSSPSGHFAPVTNLFTVTNAPYAQMITGTVENAISFANVSNAMVILFSSQNGALTPLGGAVANNSGNYALRAAPGIYLLAAAKSNFVADLSSAPTFTLNANTTNTENLSLMSATKSISGKVVDAGTNSIGLPGILGVAQSTNNLLAIYFTDTNGVFTVPVTTNWWQIMVNGSAAGFHGYLTPQDNRLIDVTNNNVFNVTNALPKATAIFYGSVIDNLNHPIPGVFLYDNDYTGRQSDGVIADQNGNYIAGALAGVWRLGVADNNPGLTNYYVVSPGVVQATIGNGQAIQQNFILRQARYAISGNVKDFEDNPIVGVQIYATATVDGTNYETFSALTDADGNYSLNVCLGDWSVNVLCVGSTNSLQSLGNYQCPGSQTVSVSDSSGDGHADFTVLLCGQIGIFTTNLPDAWVGSYYATNLQASSCSMITNWSSAWGATLTSLYDQTNVTYPPGTPVYSKPSQIGYLLSPMAFEFTCGGDDYATNVTYDTPINNGGSCAYFPNLVATVNISAPITNNIVVSINGMKWNAQPTTQNGSMYSTALTPVSIPLICACHGYNATNGTLILNTASSPNILLGTLRDSFHSITSGSSLKTDLESSYTNSDDAVAWIGNGQYLISAYGPQDTTNIFDAIPQGMILYTNGTFAGTPETNGMFHFTVRAVDASSNSTVQIVSLLVHPDTTLGTAAFSTNGQFQMQINGLAGTNYILQMSTNLASTNWMDILSTNAPGNSFFITDPNATNPSRFYRVKLAP